MGTFRLILAHARAPQQSTVVAQHVDPVWLKQRGYEIARSLGDGSALWGRRADAGTLSGLELNCRGGHALRIEAA